MAAAGTFLGILMLDTQFPRPLGDVGHAGSWRVPVQLQVVRGAHPHRVVPATDGDLLQPFIAAGQKLVDAGALAITTSCGFLVRWQSQLQAALPVPVWTSALLALPGLPTPGVMTVSAAHLGATELRAAGAPLDTPVEGLTEGCYLQTVLLGNRTELDLQQAQADAVAAARRLVGRHPRLQTILLECTNLPPYAAAIERATGRPVHHLMSLVHERWELLP
jgi:hypothetical protein